MGQASSTANVAIFLSENESVNSVSDQHSESLLLKEAIEENGWNAEIVFYSERKRLQVFKYVAVSASAFISRIDPGTLGADEANYLEMLCELDASGTVGMPHPDTMATYGEKHSLYCLKNTHLVANDLEAYFSFAEFKQGLLVSLQKGTRVLKKNRGAAGKGIWKIALHPNEEQTILIDVTEAKTNRLQTLPLDDFLLSFKPYFINTKAMLLNMPFFPRIREGEFSVLMIGRQPILVVRKSPVQTASSFSTALSAGAKHTYHHLNKWPSLTTQLLEQLPTVIQKLGGSEPPQLWTADFIKDWDTNGNDRFVLSEINASCVSLMPNSGYDVAQLLAKKILQDVHIKKQLKLVI